MSILDLGRSKSEVYLGFKLNTCIIYFACRHNMPRVDKQCLSNVYLLLIQRVHVVLISNNKST